MGVFSRSGCSVSTTVHRTHTLYMQQAQWEVMMGLASRNVDKSGDMCKKSRLLMC